MLPAGAVPLKVKVVFLVMLSVFEIPESIAQRSGVDGAGRVVDGGLTQRLFTKIFGGRQMLIGVPINGEKMPVL